MKEKLTPKQILELCEANYNQTKATATTLLAVGFMPESPTIEQLWRTFDVLLLLASQMLGLAKWDNDVPTSEMLGLSNWSNELPTKTPYTDLHWYFENKHVGDPLRASNADGESRIIATIDDLLWLIESGKNLN